MTRNADRISEAFWDYEIPLGYAAAVQMTCSEFGITPDALEEVLADEDAASNGNV